MSTFSRQRFRLVIHDFTSRRLFISLNKKKKEKFRKIKKKKRKKRAFLSELVFESIKF